MKVVIVGAGIAGLSIGWRLGQAGVEAIVLERAQPACGATWAAAGMLSVRGEGGNPAEDMLARHAARQWPEFAAEIETSSGRAIGYDRAGKLVVARNAQDHAHLAALAASDSELSMLSGVEAVALEPLLRRDIVAALWDPTEARVDNRALGSALTRAFLQAGGILQANEPAVRVETDGDRVVGVRSPFALYEADAYVLASGAWTSLIEGLPAEASLPIRPVKGEMIALSGGTPPTRSIWGDEVYIVARGGRLLVGATATHEGFDTRLTAEAGTHLLSRAVGLMPDLDRWSTVEHWAGLRPGSFDGLPLIGRTTIEALYVASGQYRNGILFGPAIADAMSALLLGRNIPFDLSPFDPRRFAPAQAPAGA